MKRLGGIDFLNKAQIYDNDFLYLCDSVVDKVQIIKKQNAFWF